MMGAGAHPPTTSKMGFAREKTGPMIEWSGSEQKLERHLRWLRGFARVGVRADKIAALARRKRRR